MKTPAISQFDRCLAPPLNGRRGERGVTMVLVALSMIAVMAMAALSIDVITLYLANAEAQRSADTAALAAARILSITGMTGDPTNANTGAGANAWQSACQLATQVATAVAQQDTVGGVSLPAGQITVSYPNNSDTQFCSGTNPAFGVNPLVTVTVQRTNLPTFFARIWGQRGAAVGATATAEAFNSSASEVSGNGTNTTLIPVQPRCVKPWLVANADPEHGGGPFITAVDGTIQNSGIQVQGSGGTGVIGENFSLTADCTETGAVGAQTCASTALKDNPPAASTAKNTLDFIPSYVTAPPVAAMSCAPGSDYGQAIAGCDQTTIYACGVPSGNQADLTINDTPDTATGASCLINADGGPDSLDETTYPYQIRAGLGNPLVGAHAVNTSDVVTASNSIVSVPILASSTPVLPPGRPVVTVVGFLQLFIYGIGGTTGTDIQVYVLNVVGCGDGTTNPVGTPVAGSSPVPVRLITYP